MREHFGQLCEANAADPAGCCIVARSAEGQEREKRKEMKESKVEHGQRMQRRTRQEVAEQHDLASKGSRRERERGRGKVKRRKAQHEINLWQLLKVQHALHQ